jgi:nicotinamidase/pyrazinamidase
MPEGPDNAVTKGGNMKNLSLLLLSLGIFTLAFAPVPALAKKGLAVVVVDVQGDFTTAHKGSLAVPNSDQAYLDSVAKATEELKKADLPVYATQDWHPTNHMSFASNHKGKKPFETIKLDDGRTQVLWPPHCVQNSKGAEILVNPALITKVIRKGMNPKFDSYSGFMDDGGSKTELDKVLKAAGIKTLIVYGIATDYCVKATALDGLKDGYKVIVVQDLCRGVADKTSKAALEEMKQKGVQIGPSLDLAKIKNL